MQTDPASEWLRLAEEYRAKSDEELRELAVDFAELTEPAQQALRAEMQSRKLGDPAAASAGNQPAIAPRFSNVPVRRPTGTLDVQQQSIFPADSVFGYNAPSTKLVPDDPGNGNEEDTGEPHDYTWMTELCELDTSVEAKQLLEVLKRAGIESWFRFGGYTTSYVPSIAQSVMQIGGIQVLVAADQLEQARAVAAQPIPKDIVEESEVEVPDYVAPKCPKCGAEDPTLESVEPANHWHCENCDAEWSDPAEPAGAKAANGSP